MTISIRSVLRSEASFASARTLATTSGGPDPEPLCPRSVQESSWVVFDDDLLRGRATAQPLRGHDGVGIIALFECCDAPLAAKALLGACEQYLSAIGCRKVIGPMDGDTWHGYRTSEESSFPPFRLDRITPGWYGRLFQAAGYLPCDHYKSTWIDRSALSWPRLERGLARHAGSGGGIESFDPLDWDAQLDRLHELSMTAFARNRWASPLDREGFHELYRGFRAVIAPDWIRWAIGSDGSALGYVFSIPDRRPDGSTIRVIKTVAVADRPEARGLGALLVELTHRLAFQEGCAGVVHALMHAGNSSTAILSKQAEVIRNYHLWAKELA